MHVRILKACNARGESLAAGQVYDLPHDVAVVLIALGRAEKTATPKSKKKATSNADS